MKAKVIEVRVSGGSGVAAEVEQAFNKFLSEEPNIKIHNTQVQAVDIGGPSQAEILVLCTVFYT